MLKGGGLKQWSKQLWRNEKCLKEKQACSHSKCNICFEIDSALEQLRGNNSDGAKQRRKDLLVVCGAFGRESDAWWSISYLIVLYVRRPTVEPLPDTGGGDSWLPLQRICVRGLACLLSFTPHSTYHKPNARQRYGLGEGGGGGRPQSGSRPGGEVTDCPIIRPWCASDRRIAASHVNEPVNGRYVEFSGQKAGLGPGVVGISFSMGTRAGIWDKAASTRCGRGSFLAIC